MRTAASNEDRTRDLLLTKEMLCQLSYRGTTCVNRTLGCRKKTKTFGKKLGSSAPIRDEKKNSTSGNRTRGVCVTGRNVTNYTNTDMLPVKKPSTFLILRTPILKERGVPSRPKSHPSIILQWLSYIPSDIIGPNQYCGEPRPMLLVLIPSLLSTRWLCCGAFNPWPFCSRFATSF